MQVEEETASAQLHRFPRYAEKTSEYRRVGEVGQNNAPSRRWNKIVHLAAENRDAVHRNIFKRSIAMVSRFSNDLLQYIHTARHFTENRMFII